MIQLSEWNQISMEISLGYPLSDKKSMIEIGLCGPKLSSKTHKKVFLILCGQKILFSKPSQKVSV